MVGLGFLIGYWLALIRAKQKGIDQDKIFKLTLLVFLGSIIGARLSYLLQFNRWTEFFLFKASGLMFYGGLLGALLISWFYFKKNKEEFLEIADLLSPSIALGIFIGRIGCFLIKDHPGAITNLPWAIQWPDGILRHPVALYLSLNGLVLFLILWFSRNRLQKSGQLFAIFLIYYSFSRFFLEFTRVGDPQIFNLFISQWISLVILIGVFVFLKKKV